jgi:tetratricopeptide (TPR) repeat protein
LSAERPDQRRRAGKVVGKTFTTREIARLTGLTQRRVRRCVHAGFLTPGRGPSRHFEYSLADLLVLRATKGLLAARLGPRRIALLVGELRRQLGAGRDVQSLKIKVEGDQVVVSDGRSEWRADSGQLLLRFDPTTGRGGVLPLDPEDAATAAARAAYMAVSRGLALERRSPEEAKAAYAEALRLEPNFVAALVNLGRLLHEEKDYAAAEKHYQAALRIDPHEATAAFNLAVLAEDRHERGLAIRRYQQALLVAPNLVEAHRALSRLYAETGNRPAARRHSRLYRGLPHRRR